jgi:hypothetical protein
MNACNKISAVMISLRAARINAAALFNALVNSLEGILVDRVPRFFATRDSSSSILPFS